MSRKSSERWVLSLVLAGCVRASPVAPRPPPAAQSPARVTLSAFVSAVEAGDFARALSFTSSRWRARYTAEEFAADYRADPLAKARLDQLRVEKTPCETGRVGGECVISIGPGKAIRLVEEADGFKLSALE